MRVVISGASSGLGFALAQHYLDQGAAVAVLARRADLLQLLVDAYPGRVFCFPLDVCDSVAMQNAASEILSSMGCPDVVIANAGVSMGTLTEDQGDIEAFRQILDINVLGMIKTFQPFISAMRTVEGGTLVGIASVAGFRGLPGSGAYSASKAAAISYLESLRVELRGSGIKVVTICPGYVRTPMTAVNQFTMPFILEADDAAGRIVRAIKHQTAFAVIPWQMTIVGIVLKILPRWLFDRIFVNAPRKPRVR